MSGDDLATAIRAVTSAESHPAFFRMVGIGHTGYFTDGSPAALIADAAELQDAMWPAVKRVARSWVARGDGLVLDWWLLSPHHVAELADEEIDSVWMWIEPDALHQRERLNADFLEGSTDPERMLSNFMARSLWRNQYVRAEAERLGLPVIQQHGDKPVADLVAATLEAIDWRTSP